MTEHAASWAVSGQLHPSKVAAPHAGHAVMQGKALVLPLDDFYQVPTTWGYYGVDNMGMAEHAYGTVDNDVWTYTNEGKMNGKSYKGRYTMTNMKPDSYDFKFEMSEDGSTWNTVMEGKNTKKAAEKPAAKPAEKKAEEKKG